MDEFGSGAIQLELKYCERCGGLWLRPKSSDLVLCSRCTRVMAGLLSLPSGRSSSEGRHPASVRVGFWSEGGNA